MWMQRLTGTGVAVGGVIAYQFLPILLFALPGGGAADRYEKRRVLLYAQSAAGLLAAGLGAVVTLGLANVTLVYVFVFALGVVDAFDNPVRQALIVELVGTGLLPNALDCSLWF